MSELVAAQGETVEPIRARLRRRLLSSTRSRYADFLPEAQAIAAREASPLARALIVIITLLFAIALIWAWLAEVEQVATAPAVVRPVGKVKIVNHPDGGRVAAIHVREGEKVTAEQKLIEFDAGAVAEETARRTTEWRTLSAEAVRLAAEARGATPDFPSGLAAARPDLVRAQIQLFETRRRALDSRRAVGDRVIEQRGREAGVLAARLKQLKRSLAILSEQERAIAELAGKGYFPRLRHLSVKRQISELKGKISETRESGRAALSALSEARSRRRSVDREWRAETLSRLADVKRQVEISKSVLTQNEGRLRSLVVRAPTAGMVQNLAVTSPGQAVAANETLLIIVPSRDRLIIEAQVSNDDIGYVRIGQKASVKVQTYDFIRYGTLSGVVEHVAADATEDPRSGVRTFSVLVRAEQTWLSDGNRKLPVNPGMQVSVDLHVGDRSILSYLTDRINRSAQSAFRER